MSRAIVVPVIRELARCYQAFQRVSDAHVRRTGLTPAQFDIVVTLGNTEGMTFKELGSRTLITKGTLTGVVDRLEARGLVERLASPTDGRSTLVRLTAEGDRVFREVSEPHLAFRWRPPSSRCRNAGARNWKNASGSCARPWKREAMDSAVRTEYTGTAIALHWIAAALIAGNLALGLYMVGLPLSPAKLRYYSWHKWAGVTIFLVSAARLLWRLTHPAPALPSSMPPWQRSAAVERIRLRLGRARLDPEPDALSETRKDFPVDEPGGFV